VKLIGYTGPILSGKKKDERKKALSFGKRG